MSPAPAVPPNGHQVTGPAGGGRVLHRARPGISPRRAAAAVGLGAVVIGVVLGGYALMQRPATPRAAPPSIQQITVSAPVLPPAADLVALTQRPPDYGALIDPVRRGACLSALGYPARTTVLGARTLTLDGQPAILLVLAGDDPSTLAVKAVAPRCSAADTALIADTTIARP